MSKTLYMFHIPKCSGMSISPISFSAVDAGIPAFPNRSNQILPFTDYGYIQGHFGTLPMAPEVDTAILVRDPVDRSISHFLWMFMRGSSLWYPKYMTGDLMVDKLRYFLFEDPQFLVQRNLQAKFLCSSMKPLALEAMYSPKITDLAWVEERAALGPMSREQGVADFYLEDTPVSLEAAKATIDKAVILGTVETHDVFVQKLLDWFTANYSVDLKAGYDSVLADWLAKKAGPYVNSTRYEDYNDGITYTTASLKAMLTPAEIQQIEDNNQIDRQIYEYVKAKLS